MIPKPLQLGAAVLLMILSNTSGELAKTSGPGLITFNNKVMLQAGCSHASFHSLLTCIGKFGQHSKQGGGCPRRPLLIEGFRDAELKGLGILAPERGVKTQNGLSQESTSYPKWCRDPLHLMTH